jgi:hypothetical protein
MQAISPHQPRHCSIILNHLEGRVAFRHHKLLEEQKAALKCQPASSYVSAKSKKVAACSNGPF